MMNLVVKMIHMNRNESSNYAATSKQYDGGWIKSTYITREKQTKKIFSKCRKFVITEHERKKLDENFSFSLLTIEQINIFLLTLRAAVVLILFSTANDECRQLATMKYFFWLYLMCRITCQKHIFSSSSHFDLKSICNSIVVNETETQQSSSL